MSQSNTPLSPFFNKTTATIAVNTTLQYPTRLKNRGLMSVTITPSQAANGAGEEHSVKFNEDDGDAFTFTGTTALTVNLVQDQDSKYSIVKLFLTSGKNGTTFAISGNV